MAKKRSKKPKPGSNWHHKDGSGPPGIPPTGQWSRPVWGRLIKSKKCKVRDEPHDWELREDASTFEVERFRCKICGWWARRYTSSEQKTPVPYNERVPSGQKSDKVKATVMKPDETWSKADLLHYRRNAKI